MKRDIILFCCLLLCRLMSAQDVLSFSFVGDIMPGSIYKGVGQTADAGKTLFIDATPIFNSVDFALGNLETTLADHGTPRNQGRDYMFLTPTHYGEVLKKAGFDFLSVANNHSYDFGEGGITSTLRTLKKNNISCSGLKRQAPYELVELKGVKVAICAFGFNFYCNQINDLKAVKHILDEASAKADVVIVSFHGGAEGKEYRNLPTRSETFLGENRGDLRKFAHFCIDNGADIIYGHGPHVVRAVEVYKNRIIAYSLGNFCTPYGISVSGINAYAPILTVDVDGEGRFIGGRIYSLIQHRGIGPRLDPHLRALKEIRSLSDDNIANGAMNITSSGHIVTNTYLPTKNELEEESEEYYDEGEIDWTKTGW